MKKILLPSLTEEAPPNTELALTFNRGDRFDRRSLLKLGAIGLGVLASAGTALAQFNQPYFSQPLPPPLPLPPGQSAGLAFEVGSGVHPHAMVRLVREYIALTLAPDSASQIVEARIVQRTPTAFHEQFWSNFSLYNPIPPTRSRYGHYVGIDDLARADSRPALRVHKDWNFFEMRRVITACEISQFGVVLYPCGHRAQPTPADFQSYARVCRTLYGIEHPQRFQLLYTRPFSDGRRSFTGYLVARVPEPMRSPYGPRGPDPMQTPYGAPVPDPMRTPFKDLLLDNVPV